MHQAGTWLRWVETMVDKLRVVHPANGRHRAGGWPPRGKPRSVFHRGYPGYSLRSPFGPACGCYSAPLLFGLLNGEVGASVRSRIEKQKACCGVCCRCWLGHQGGQASRCPPYKWPPPRRVDGHPVENREAFSTMDTRATRCAHPSGQPAAVTPLRCVSAC